MKNANHPLMMALQSKKKPSDKFELPEAQQLFDLHSKDVPAIKTMRPGDPLRIEVHGKIKSMHDDGRATMEVHKVMHDDDGDESYEDNSNSDSGKKGKSY